MKWNDNFELLLERCNSLAKQEKADVVRFAFLRPDKKEIVLMAFEIEFVLRNNIWRGRYGYDLLSHWLELPEL